MIFIVLRPFLDSRIERVNFIYLFIFKLPTATLSLGLKTDYIKSDDKIRRGRATGGRSKGPSEADRIVSLNGHRNPLQ